jgi:hypothetical protein
MVTEKNQRKNTIVKNMERKKSTVNTKKIMKNMDMMTMGIKMSTKVDHFMIEQ